MGKKVDNWENRSYGMICRTCIYFVEKTPRDSQVRDVAIGRCRRNAPTMRGWPVMFSSDWCGAHKLDENKI